jgi:hypothetical protein
MVVGGWVPGCTSTCYDVLILFRWKEKWSVERLDLQCHLSTTFPLSLPSLPPSQLLNFPHTHITPSPTKVAHNQSHPRSKSGENRENTELATLDYDSTALRRDLAMEVQSGRIRKEDCWIW